MEVELNPYLPSLKIQSAAFNQKSLDLFGSSIFYVFFFLS